jgi:transposase-like protein
MAKQKGNKAIATKEQKLKAIEEYKTGAKSAKQISEQFGSSNKNLIHAWKYEFEEKAKGERVDELKNTGYSSEAAKRILELEQEVIEYQKKLAEQVLINDLLKKLRSQPNFQPEKNVTGLTDIIRSLNQKKKPVK